MRLSFPALTAAVATVMAVFACSSSQTGQDVQPNDAPDGAVVLADGAIIGPDGEIVTPDADANADADAAKPSKVNVSNETVTVMGETRKYLLVVPKTYDAARKYPLVIALPGDGEDGDYLRGLLPLDDVMGDDAIVAYPADVVDLFTPYDQNPDQQLVQATITAVSATRSIDPAKVWGFGYSKGGFIANEIACRKPGILKAMALHAGGAPQETQGPDGFPQCPGVIGLPVLAAEGEFDTAIGGDYGAQYWSKVNGCGATRTATTPAGCQKVDGCPADKPVTYCLAAGVGHYPPWDKAPEVSWAFFTSL